MFGRRTPGPRKAATGICKPGALCQNPGFGFGFFLHGIIASVKALEYGPQCPYAFLLA